MGLKRNPQKHRTHGIIVKLDAYATEWNTYAFTLGGASSHTFEDILHMSLLAGTFPLFALIYLFTRNSLAGQEREIQQILDNVLHTKQKNGTPMFGGLAIYVAKAVDKDDCFVVTSSSLIIETSMLEDLPESEGWMDNLDLALRVSSYIALSLCLL